MLRASQSATGEENNFTVQIYGQKGSLKWGQENPNYLTYLQEGQPRAIKPGYDFNTKAAQEATKLHQDIQKDSMTP